MKISGHWLAQYVPHSLTPDQLSHRLTMCGLEVDDEIRCDITVRGIVCGQVLDVRPHPNADRLTVCKVEVGQQAPLGIVCGAPNVAADQHVAVATVGAALRLPGKARPLKIRKSKIRGVVSMGMICAEDELGLSGDHSGILVLDDHAAPGEPFAAYLERAGVTASDTVFDVALTPNRPDAACHMGAARDISACCDLPLRRPQVAVPAPGGRAAKDVSVRIECPDKCRRYVVMTVYGVTVAPSPLWLRRRLFSIGLRPINNVVDVTNLVMFECGQPLHAFDYDRIATHTIVVRESVEGERFTTLDGKERHLKAGTVLICDAERPVALGGIMGGKNTEVTSDTTCVLVESAYFDPSCTRSSARALGLSTDASYRFERGVDAADQPWAAARAAALIAELAGGTVADGMVDAHPNPQITPMVRLRSRRIQKILGMSIPDTEAARILEALGFHLEPTRTERGWRCQVPPWRPDVSQEIDLIEEVARIHGLDNIPLPQGTQILGSVPQPRPEDQLRAEVYGMMGGRGYREIYTNSLLPKAEAETFCHAVLAARGPVVETLNAVSRTMTTLRPSLLPGALQVMSHNQKHGQQVLRFFEFGHVFHRVADHVTCIPGYSEYDALAMVISGLVAPPEWGEKARVADFYDLKGDVETLLEALRVLAITMETSHAATVLTHYHAVIRSDGVEIGRMGRLNNTVSTARDIREPVYFAEFNWTRLVLQVKDHAARRYAPVSRFPAVTRDLSLVVDRRVPAAALGATIQEAGKPLLKMTTVFDLFPHHQAERTHHCIGFTLRFAAARTLRDREVEEAIGKILRVLSQRHGAELRGP